MLAIAQGIHQLPKASVVVGVELAFCGDSGADNPAFTRDDAIDPAAIALGLLFEDQHPAPLQPVVGHWSYLPMGACGSLIGMVSPDWKLS